jgi:hypothetical protein
MVAAKLYDPTDVRKNGLSLVLLSLFLLSMAGQALTGWLTHNDEQEQHGQTPVALISYLASGHFWEATGENWESEFLQMAAFVLLTTFLYQAGSAESKRVGAVEDVDLDPRRFRDQPEVPGPVRRGGWLLTVYEHSLGLTFTALFLVSIAIHGVGGLAQHNMEELAHGGHEATLIDYMSSSVFWFESFQNWQSEFLSLAGMVLGTVWLRQRGSCESKPVYAPHNETGR